MSEQTNLGCASPESVALELTINIAAIERLDQDSQSYREELLNLYAECLEATSHARDISETEEEIEEETEA